VFNVNAESLKHDRLLSAQKFHNTMSTRHDNGPFQCQNVADDLQHWAESRCALKNCIKNLSRRTTQTRFEFLHERLLFDDGQDVADLVNFAVRGVNQTLPFIVTVGFLQATLLHLSPTSLQADTSATSIISQQTSNL